MTDSMLIKYGARSPVSRWFQDYWTERDKRAAPYLLLSILVGVLLLGPQILLWLASYLPLDQLGNSGASIIGHQILVLVTALLALLTSVPIVKLLLKPRYLAASAAGIRRVWTLGLIDIKGKILPWSEVTSVKVICPSDTTDMRSYQIYLGTTKTPAKMKLRLGELESDDSRDEMLTTLSRWATNATIEPIVFEVLTPRRNLSFTEIWLDALSAPPSRQNLIPLSEGTLLDGRYRLVKRLGSGGQGTVYLANDAEEKPIVLKETILPVYADLISRRQALEDFHKEAFALESVKHPNIVKFLGSFVADHRAYLVLNYIEGRTLREVVRERLRLSVDETISLGIQMCDILAALHCQSPPLIHRDFTPDNLILDKDNKLVLLDFAVAVAGDRNSLDVAGKASYMAPEQFQGRPTIQSDVYSAGCTLSYLLTGQDPDPLTECFPLSANSDMTQALNDIVGKATKYHNKERYGDVATLKSALQALS